MAVFKQINSYLLVLSREYGAKSSLVLRSHLLFNIEGTRFDAFSEIWALTFLRLPPFIQRTKFD